MNLPIPREKWNIEIHTVYQKKIDSPVFFQLQRDIKSNLQTEIYIQIYYPIQEIIRNNVAERILVKARNDIKYGEDILK